MRLGGEVEHARLAPFRQLDIVFLSLAVRDVIGRQVGQAQQQVAELALLALELRAQRGDDILGARDFGL